MVVEISVEPDVNKSYDLNTYYYERLKAETEHLFRNRSITPRMCSSKRLLASASISGGISNSTSASALPIVTINLDRLTGSDGSPIGHFLSKKDGEVIAAVLGKTFKAEWIYTSWAYPVTSEGDEL